MIAPRVHHAARRRGGAWPLAARAQQPERMRRIGMLLPAAADDPEFQARFGGVPAGAGSNWAGPSAATCGSTSAGPRPMPPTFADTRRNWSRSRRTSSWPHGAATVAAVAAGDPHGADRVRDRRRSGRRRLRRQPGAAGRQRHRLHQFRIRHGREMAGTAQADRAERDASGGPSGSRPSPSAPASSASIQAVAPSLGMEVSPINVRDVAPRSSAPSTAFARIAEWRSDRDGRARLRAFIAI